jgi:hypothetical protein
VITGRTEQVLTDTFYKLKQEALKADLIINTNKTKYLHCTRKFVQQNHLIAGGERLEQVRCFKHLGTMVNTAAIQERVTALLLSIPKEAFADSFQKLYERCQPCVVKDEYFEGQ